MGTPITRLMLERCALTIEQVIIPNLSGEFALEQAVSIATVLRSLAPVLEEKGPELVQENEGMRAVLGRVLAMLRGEKALSRNAVRNDLVKKLDRELKSVKAARLGVGEENLNLKTLLMEAIMGLDALTEDMPAEAMSSVRQEIRSVLRQQVDHGLTRAGAWMEAHRTAREATGVTMPPMFNL